VGKKSLFLCLGCLALAWLCLTRVASANQASELDTLLDKIQHTYERTRALTEKQKKMKNKKQKKNKCIRK